MPTPQFKPTRWSLINDLSSDESSQQDKDVAFTELCEAYREPIRAFIRRSGYSEHDAQDLTQEFFHLVIRGGTFAKAKKSKGRFRTFILACLKNILKDQRDFQIARKRDARKLVSYDALGAEERSPTESDDQLTPDRLFDRTFARKLLQRAASLHEAEAIDKGQLEIYRALEPHLYEGDSYATLSKQLGRPVNTIKSDVHRLREARRRHIREEVAQLVAHPTDIHDELMALMNSL